MKRFTLLKSMLLLCALVAGSMNGWADPVYYSWNGNGSTSTANETGGTAEAVQASGTNIAVGNVQKGNYTLKINKKFDSGVNYIDITLDNALKGGETITIGVFRTSSSSDATLGVDFGTTATQSTKANPDAITASTGIPSDWTFKVPAGASTSKKVRLYRTSGSTGLYVSKLIIEPSGPSAPTDNGDGTITLTTTANMDGWRAFYNNHATKDYEVDANTTIYTVQAKSGTENEVELTASDKTKIPKGQAVILKTTDAGRSMTLTETTGAASLGTNLLAATNGSSNVDGYRLGYGKIGGSSAVGFFKYKTTTAPAAGIVYIDKNNVNIGTGAHGLAITFGEDEGNVTGVNDVKSLKTDVRGEYFNLAGQRVAQPTKGLYIVNGKKVIIK